MQTSLTYNQAVLNFDSVTWRYARNKDRILKANKNTKEMLPSSQLTISRGEQLSEVQAWNACSLKCSNL